MLAAVGYDLHFTHEYVSVRDTAGGHFDAELRAQVGYGGGGSPHNKGGRRKGEGGFLIRFGFLPPSPFPPSPFRSSFPVNFPTDRYPPFKSTSKVAGPCKMTLAPAS